jgi:LuxR family transcriptional regulator, maltose regulon positive regulatory protein
VVGRRLAWSRKGVEGASPYQLREGVNDPRRSNGAWNAARDVRSSTAGRPIPRVTAPEQLLTRAKEALGNANWDAAKRLFAEALERGESPDVLEGLGMAAFFLDEAEVALEARERAYAAYRADSRGIDAARVAIALAWNYRAVRGEWAVADGWLARARRLLEGCGPTPERGWPALREASFALPENAALARERCEEAEALGRELGDVDLEMTALALDGLARVSQGSPYHS